MGIEDEARRKVKDDERIAQNLKDADRPRATPATREYVDFAKRHGIPTHPVVESQWITYGSGRRERTVIKYPLTGENVYHVSYFDSEDRHHWAIGLDGVAQECHEPMDSIGVQLKGGVGWNFGYIEKACIESVAWHLKNP